MDKDECTLLSLRQGITDNNLHVKAIIQVIYPRTKDKLST